jgi:hypothetical protein
MARKFRSAIADAACLQNVMEGRIPRNALRFDPQRPRSDLLDFGLSEPAAGAAVADLGMTHLIANYVAAASRLEMLILGEDDRIRNADASATPV